MFRGSPQGTILWHALFLLYVNNVAYMLPIYQVCHYADDVILFKQIVNIHIIEFSQTALNNLVWTKTWYLCLSINNKCACLHNCLFKQFDIFACTIDSNLGVIILENLSFSKNCINIVKLACSCCIQIFKSYKSHSVNFYIKVFSKYF